MCRFPFFVTSRPDRDGRVGEPRSRGDASHAVDVSGGRIAGRDQTGPPDAVTKPSAFGCRTQAQSTLYRRDPERERGRLDQRLDGEVDPQGENELLELGEKQRGQAQSRRGFPSHREARCHRVRPRRPTGSR